MGRRRSVEEDETNITEHRSVLGLHLLDAGGDGDVLQLGEQLGQHKEGNVLVGPIRGVGGDGGDVGVTGLPDAVVHAVRQSLAVREVELLADGKLLLGPHLAVTIRTIGKLGVLASRGGHRGHGVLHHVQKAPPVTGGRLAGVGVNGGGGLVPRHHVAGHARGHLGDVHVDGAIDDVDRHPGSIRLSLSVPPHQLKGQLRIGHFVHFVIGIDMNRLELRVNLHENRFYSVGNWVTRMVNVIKKLDSVPGQDVVMIVSVGRVPPPEAEEHRERGAETDEVLYPEHEAALGRLGRLGRVREVAPAAASGRGGAWHLGGAPRVLHILAPARQHVIRDNTA